MGRKRKTADATVVKDKAKASKPKKLRVVFPQEHREHIARILRNTFMHCGLSMEQADKARTAGSQGMQKWIEWWIGRHTDYLETKKSGRITNSQILQGLGAWIYYKSTVEVVDKLGPTAADE